MGKSFYHYIVKYRGGKNSNELTKFANNIYDDHSFPKYSSDYHEISSYLELNGHFLSSMTLFDTAWEMYENED